MSSMIIATFCIAYWKEMFMENHERTIVRLFNTEESINPEIQVFTQGMTVDEIIGTVGSLEVAKKMLINQIPVEDIDDEEEEQAQNLTDKME